MPMVDIVVEDTSNELKIKTGKDDEYEHLIMPMLEIVVEDKSNELMIKTDNKDDKYEHLIVPMVEIVVEDVKLQSVWIPVLRTLATLVKANKFKQSGENMRICLFVIGHS